MICKIMYFGCGFRSVSLPHWNEWNVEYNRNVYVVVINCYNCHMRVIYGGKEILAIQFGIDCLQMSHDCLKDEQRKAILKVLEGNYCFISLPTGYGKSLIFQILPFPIEYYRKYEEIPPIIF